ncbi:MAG: hypothetical protein EXQ70_00950 [Solirubrobacterales bacterium]|nr:hypothetical protein [Solirubrobacterales bacterium]
MVGVAATALLVLLAAGTSNAVGPDGPAATLSLRALGGEGRAAGTSAGYALIVNGNPGVANRVKAWSDSTGRLYVSDSAGGIDPPTLGAGVPDPECQDEGEAAISCSPGHIGTIYGDLGDLGDRFTAAAGLATPVGVVISGAPRFLDGGRGTDRLLGGGSGDQLRGGPGADTVKGAGGDDTLLGGAGPDLLQGGTGDDFCNGGSRRDRAKGCETRRRLP